MTDLARLAADVEQRLTALPRARRRGAEISFSCVLGDRHTNGDATPSASYSVTKRAWRCAGCGASGGLIAGAQPLAPLLGIDVDAYRDTEPRRQQSSGRPDRSWELRDAKGELVAVHHRKDQPDGRKRVWWAMPDGSIGLGGRKSADLPLYGVERLGEREPGEDEPIVVCEGEPATDALLELGLRAVGTVTGASSAPSVASLEPLRGADVVLWPDADAHGRAHMEQLAARLERIAASVRVFEPQGAAETDDAADWTEARADLPNLATVLLEEIDAHARAIEPQAPAFERLPDGLGYRLTAPALAAALEVSQLRRDRHQLRGELQVRCTLPGASTFGGDVLSIADVNLSSARSRKEHAGHLAEQARTDAAQWHDAVEQFAQKVLAAERAGEPDVCLADVQPEPVRVLEIDGLRLPRHHPAILFGDGDSAKSYLALYVLGRLACEGLRVGLADWELSEVDHRERLGRLFPDALPGIRYLRCARSIIHESDRLRRWVREQQLDYVAMDSVAYASAGAPESAEIAMAYFQVVRQLGQIGSLHIAHITKNGEAADRRPFGSAFWHNSPRATWFCKVADRDPGGTVSRLGLYPRKWNVGPLPSAVGLELVFGGARTTVRRVELTDTAELAASLPLKQRMIAALRAGRMSATELAEELDTTAQTVRSMVRRHAGDFLLENGAISLLERRSV